MPTEPISKFIETLGRARLADEPLPDIPDDQRPGTEAAGYGIQAELATWFRAQEHGDIAGYKIGATTQTMQDLLGVPGPIYGHIMSACVHTSGVSIACNPDCKPGVECEIAYRIGMDFPASRSSWTRGNVADYIEGAMPGIELVENRYGDYRSCGIGTLVADDFFHKACVLGAPIADWRTLDLASVEGRTLVNGLETGAGRGREVLGHPLEAVAWLANKMAEHGKRLKSGQVVLTGSLTSVFWLEAFPSRVEIEIGGLGASAVELTERP